VYFIKVKSAVITELNPQWY